MEPVFTLPYSEYETILLLQKHLTKKDGYAFFVPTSRQQKGIDFIIHNTRTKRVLSVQVKSSRSWQNNQLDINKSPKQYYHNLFFRNYINSLKDGLADIFILFGLYPVYYPDKNIKSKASVWKNVLLIFDKNEMYNILKQVKTKKGNPDPFFYISFNNLSDIVVTRGFKEHFELTDYLLDNQISLLKRLLD